MSHPGISFCEFHLSSLQPPRIRYPPSFHLTEFRFVIRGLASPLKCSYEFFHLPFLIILCTLRASGLKERAQEEEFAVGREVIMEGHSEGLWTWRGSEFGTSATLMLCDSGHMT